MPPKLCGKCDKTVYPTEELKCLDKVWHKGCFKCEICNMTLNMKNYKGYDKLPYCTAHYPTTKHTAVADTPEIRRIQENTKIQSNIQYHAEFEKQKGKKTDIAEDPEMMRVKKNMEVISNVSYHGDKERREQMEQARPAEQLEGGRNVRSNPGRIADMEPAMEPAGGTPYSNRNSASARQVYDSNVGKVEQPARRNVGSISDYDPLNEKYGSIAGQNNPRGQPAQQAYQPPAQSYQPPPQAYQPPPPANPAPAAGKGMVCQAMYDYDAADADEVSFREGDKIVFCQPIDAGWMEGTVERTGKRGMLPSNYVEKMN
ncbi:LIM and SH3 domain protein F42H10.3-like isoform X2 [Dreissena polymorpha]|uniref:LIM and SH3 domain protein F42H10.3-like isoform X2 n=1 Tax=Dreissena polymorpha TaxID=45954 RepID=UPI0022654277|nr:LIM and SH3 domain protein F42H10.3-like isoform X2 [Dreissena polymorpha]XP_052255338.1 LIM and SH3 domain protein F42H10.3-like isoform X2 [Dreissena polymorpha]